jgi:hypothetical protein
MELTWGNLRKLFELASQGESYNAPYVDPSDDTMCIDGWITREFVERFIAEQNKP